jgi:hypothetical protein
MSSTFSAVCPEGISAPPVAPEVINIFLFQRSCKPMDALSEHIIVSMFSYGCSYLESIFSSAFHQIVSKQSDVR